jgi:Arc/MetJ-type ribon-helix-helix transcriptional regulator
MNIRPGHTPPDRRATRLLALSRRAEPLGPAAVTGLEALGLVISHYGIDRLVGRGDRRTSDHALRDAVRRLTAEARDVDAVRAERLVIGLRQAWSQLPAVQELGIDSPRGDLWDRVVRLCCEEFYASATPAVYHPSTLG